MKYIVGFDGGGTKTRCVLGDLEGNILADFTSNASNHQTVGIAETKSVLNELLNKVLATTNANLSDINFAFLGLAGADLQPDFDLLNDMCSEIFGNVKFEVVNDAWIIMRSGTSEPYGAVSICGTGANAGATNKNGDMKILRALYYDLGGAGGGGEIASSALHYAFRSDEKTYTKTSLETEVPKVLGYESINSLLDNLYPVDKISGTNIRKLPPLVFKLAGQGDIVSQEILIDKGRTQGQMLNGVLEQAGMIGKTFPIILGGSIFKGESDYFKEAMKSEIHRLSPEAVFKYADLQPVAGAYLFGLDRINIKLNDYGVKSLYSSLQLNCTN